MDNYEHKTRFIVLKKDLSVKYS